MKTSKNGKKLIELFEGCKLTSYICPAGKWTIGVGHTGTVDKKRITKGLKITQEKADELLTADIVKFEKLVSKYNKVYNWNQNEFDALVSFAFNVGNIDQLTAKGTRSKELIARKILLYNKSNGIPLEGLTARRLAERKLFIKEVK